MQYDATQADVERVRDTSNRYGEDSGLRAGLLAGGRNNGPKPPRTAADLLTQQAAENRMRAQQLRAVVEGHMAVIASLENEADCWVDAARMLPHRRSTASELNGEGETAKQRVRTTTDDWRTL